MKPLNCALVGAPVQSGASQPGCVMGPDAFRTAGLERMLRQLGHKVVDKGNVAPVETARAEHDNTAIRNLSATKGWVLALERAAYDACQDADVPIFLGGDHSLAMGTVPGVARYWRDQGRAQFVLWLDAHPDLHSLESTESGFLHGTPVAYFTGQDGFGPTFPQISSPIPAQNVCMIGIRSVDVAEKARLSGGRIVVHDMRSIDEAGIKAPLETFLKRVKAENGALHVSFDVDFLDPSIAPAVGTTIPGGATFREAHLVMEMLCDSGLVTSLDLVELNPFLDDRGRTATLMVDLCASLMGRTVLDRPTHPF